MITELRVRDLAVIRDVTLPLGPGLNVLTGETGAGKSMLVDALALLLGERASSDVIRPGAARCVVEAAFDVDAVPTLRTLSEDIGIDIEDERLTVRRDINAEGRNRAWANGSPTTVSALATLSRRLVDLHGQHEAQSLLKGPSQRQILDAFGGARSELERTRIAFERAAALRGEEEELAARRDDVRRRADYLEHVAREISEAAPRPGEYEDLELESKRLSNVEELTRHCERLSNLLELEGDEGAAMEFLSQAARELTQIERIDESVGRWRELLETAQANVEELLQEIREYASSVEHDPARLDVVEQRRDVLYRLKQKYGPAIEDVILAGEQAKRELELLDTADFDLERMSESRAQAEAEFEAAAEALSRTRRAAAEELSRAVETLFPGLGLANGRFAAEVRPADRPSASGKDVVEFLVQLNVGMEARPLAHVASGGELSRIMLALKVVLAQHDAVPTLVFDEVDQGIGGEVAVRVSEALAEVARTRQVLIITHLPQIAVAAERHLHVGKGVEEGMATSEVRVLDGAARVDEIARMLGNAGDPAALTHAEEMLRRSGRAAERSGGETTRRRMTRPAGARPGAGPP